VESWAIRVVDRLRVGLGLVVVVVVVWRGSAADACLARERGRAAAEQQL